MNKLSAIILLVILFISDIFWWGMGSFACAFGKSLDCQSLQAISIVAPSLALLYYLYSRFNRTVPLPIEDNLPVALLLLAPTVVALLTGWPSSF